MQVDIVATGVAVVRRASYDCVLKPNFAYSAREAATSRVGRTGATD